MKPFKVLMISLMLAALLLVNIPVRGAANAVILPPTAKVQGKTLGQWGAEYWRATFAIPFSENPVVGNPWPTCYLEKFGHVALVVGYGIPNGGTTDCEIPAGQFLYILVIGTECSSAEPPPFHGENEAELRTCVQTIASFNNVEASIDGVTIQNIEKYRAISPLYQFTVPDDNLLAAPAGTYESIAENIAFMLAPMSVGLHTIHVHGEVADGSFNYDWVYHIRVTP